MEHADLEQIARQHLTKRMTRAGVTDGVLRICDTDAFEDETASTPYTQFRATILRPGPDFVVFYDGEGRLTGWRDDGRLGDAHPSPGKAEEARIRAMNELVLPQKTRAGRHRTVEMPPLGWVTETVLLADQSPSDHQVLKIWANPTTCRTIQWVAKAGIGPRTPPGPPLSDHAAATISAVLQRRLETIVLTIQPKWFFEVKAHLPEPVTAGQQVRVQTWRHWSDAWVTIDPVDGLICGDRMDRLAEPATQVQQDQDAVLAAVNQFFQLPQDAVLTETLSETIAQDHRVDTLVFTRQVNGLRVEGDFIEISVHPTTGEIVRHDFQWRPFLETSEGAAISLAAAQAIVERQRAALEIDPDLQFRHGELAIVPAREPEKTTRPNERPKAWCLTYEANWGDVVVQVNAATGAVLHIQRSA